MCVMFWLAIGSRNANKHPDENENHNEGKSETIDVLSSRHFWKNNAIDITEQNKKTYCNNSYK